MTLTRKLNSGRTICCIAIELTPEELYNAYLEQEAIFDEQTAKNFIEEADEKEFKSDYGIGKSKALKSATAIAKEMRRRINHDNLDWQTATEQSIKAVCGGDKQ